MAELRRLELDEVVHRPGTYVNPHTEIVIVVDDSASVDQELLGGDEDSWVLVSDETPIDEAQRDDMLERLQRRASRARPPAAAFDDTDTLDDEVEEDEEDLGKAGFDDPRAHTDEDEDEDWS
jgi:hypothetical protein